MEKDKRNGGYDHGEALVENQWKRIDDHETT